MDKEIVEGYFRDGRFYYYPSPAVNKLKETAQQLRELRADLEKGARLH